jgi:uncharacterized protein YaaR (DUF327 family)
MARIDSLGEAYQYPLPEKKKTGKKEKTRHTSFSRLVESAAEGGETGMESLSAGGQRGNLEELLDGVFSAGDVLKKTLTLEAIKEYRQRVKAFIAFVVDHGIAVEETTSGTNIMKRKRFTMIKVIDEKLEALTASVLAAQKEQIAILAQIDEINGLLVNLVS